MMRTAAMAAAVIALGAGAWLLLRPANAPATDKPNPTATAFLAHYVDEAGRIADTANGGISHSEGQGYGLLMAEAAGDRAVFDRILGWTETHLGVRADGLFSWRWDPVENAVTDENNASDGEILIAWALLRAGDRWPASGYRQRAEDILDTAERSLLHDTVFGPVILPGAFGFEQEDGVVVNPSYWVFPAIHRFAEEGRPVWKQVARAGYKLAEQAGLGAYGLSPDWVQISADGSVAPAPGWPPEFGYNAVRVPLHICWAQLASGDMAPPGGALEGYAQLWRDHAPDAFDRWNVSTDQPAGGPAPPGYPAIAHLVRACTDQTAIRPAPSIAPGDAYYSAALTGLVSIAIQESERPEGR